MGAEIFRHDQQGRAKPKVTVWKRSSLVRRQVRCFCLGLGNERRPLMHIVTCWCEGVRDGASLSLSLAHARDALFTVTHAAHTQSLTPVLYYRGAFS